jgi:hypothetical protein
MWQTPWEEDLELGWQVTLMLVAPGGYKWALGEIGIDFGQGFAYSVALEYYKTTETEGIVPIQIILSHLFFLFIFVWLVGLFETGLAS